VSLAARLLFICLQVLLAESERSREPQQLRSCRDLDRREAEEEVHGGRFRESRGEVKEAAPVTLPYPVLFAGDRCQSLRWQSALAHQLNKPISALRWREFPPHHLQQVESIVRHQVSFHQARGSQEC